MSRIRIEGAEELKRTLAELDAKLQKQIARKALRAGAKPIRDEARANANVRTGLMQSEIKVRAGRSRRGIIRVLVALGSKAFQGKAFYGNFVNFGHFVGKRTRLLRLRGRGEAYQQAYAALSRKMGRKFVPGRHFMEHAFEAKKDEALSIATESMVRQIEEELK